ncbi:MAG: conjugal transfer protein TraM [Pseudomonadota bacterium]
MPDQIEELIQKIAAKHGISVERENPMVILQTINQHLLQESASTQQAQLEQFKEELEVLLLRWRTDAKENAERIVNAALAAGKEAANHVMQEGAKTATTAMKTEIDNSLDRLARQTRNAHRSAMLNLVAACITILAAALALWGAMRL